MSIQSFYQEKLNFYGQSDLDLQKKAHFTSIGRMILFLAFGADLYFYLVELAPLYLFGGLVFLALFLFLLRVSFRLRDKLLLNQKLLFLNSNELGVLGDNPNQFNDGQSFQIGLGPQEDLDIFGRYSLFHFLNRTTTQPGSLRLAACLTGPPPSKEKIVENQRAIRLLSKQRDQAQQLTAHGLMAENKAVGIEAITSWFQTYPRLSGLTWVRIARWALPLIALSSLYFWLLTGNYWPILIAITANWTMIRPFRKYISGQHQLIGQKEALLDQYVSILKSVHGIDPGDSSKLLQLKITAGNAYQEINRLSKLASAFDQRTNMLVNLLLNSLLSYDIQYMLALENWKEKNRNDWQGWLACIGELEMLNSLAAFAYNHPQANFPVFTEGQMIIEARQLAHPLIPEKERIANDFSIGKDAPIHLVTGSNMSGKTTFLRTIAVNLILAQCGAPVTAAYFCYQPMQILSSLRTQDSLQEHSSYFLAELRKLQEIILQLEKGGPAIVLIDEILKGTNSEDKTNGSEQFIRKLLKYNCLGLFATHDLALSKMENELPGRISNYCFESQILNDQLFFDYTLKKGVAKNKNASFLMLQMGIIN